MWVIGLTGGIGSGKSSVARWFKKKGIPVLDADAMVRHVLTKDPDTIACIQEEFGPGVIAPNGEVDRPRLGKLVFADESARKALENIIYPRIEVLRQEKLEIFAINGHKLCIWDVPLLFEKGLENLVQETVLVWVPLEIQLARVKKRDKLNEEDILARINAQMPLSKKYDLANVIIDNSGIWEDTERQLEKYWQSLKVRGHTS